LTDYVRVGSPEPERVHSAEDGTVAVELYGVGRHAQAQLRPADPRVRAAEVQVRQDAPVPEHERELDEPTHAGAALHVTHVRLDGPDVEGTFGATSTENASDGLRLD